ncbi:MAG: hypothetical protein GOU98_00370 [Candidatus Altiarchaeota archaeon]|nr:hypothetical protein [Candidatus Altiarchaeota archaeon]
MRRVWVRVLLGLLLVSMTPAFANSSKDLKKAYMISGQIKDVYSELRYQDNVNVDAFVGDSFSLEFYTELTKRDDISLYLKNPLNRDVFILFKQENIIIGHIKVEEEGHYKFFLNNIIRPSKHFEISIGGVFSSYVEIDYITDPVKYYDPKENMSTNWVDGDLLGYEAIDDAVREPTNPATGSDFLASDAADDVVSEFKFSNITKVPNYITLWVHTSTGSNAEFTYYLQQNGTNRCNTAIGVSTSSSWSSCNWTTPSGNYSNMSIELGGCLLTDVNPPEQCVVYASYLEVNYDSDYPQFLDFSVNNTLLANQQFARFNLSITDLTDQISAANGTINGLNYSFIQGTGNEWYYDWQCTSSDSLVDFSFMWANDTDNPSTENTTTISDISLECDAEFPIYSLITDNSSGSVEAPGLVKASVYWQDSSSLGISVLSTNKTGSWVDESYFDFSESLADYSNFTIQTKGYGNTYTCWKVNANDTAGNLNDSMTQSVNCFSITDDVIPAWDSNYTSSTVAGAVVEHGVTWSDDGGLSGYIFSYDNCTGDFVNDSWTPLIGTQEVSAAYKGINNSVGCTIQWKFYLNDTSNNWNETDSFSYLTTENQPPTWYDNSTDKTLAGWAVSHKLRLEDEVNISGYVFSWDNGTGILVNDSWTTSWGTSYWVNVSKVVNYTVGTKVSWQVWTNDSFDNWNTTSIFTYLTKSDTNPPKWYSNSTNDTTLGEYVSHNVYWEDYSSLSGYIFSYDNCTGDFVNDSFISLSSNESWINVTKLVNDTFDCTIKWQVWVNDSWSGLLNVTDQFSYSTTYTADLLVGVVAVNNTSPTEEDQVIIEANITNLGPTIANNTVVWFNATDSNGVSSSHGLVELNLSVGLTTVSTQTTFIQGTHVINVSIWPADNVLDQDYTNNWNTTNLTVPIWSYFYGNATGTLGLAAPNESANVYVWSPQSLEGNVFIVDYDSGVDFFNMWPMNESNDLSELDLALGTENYTDNIEKTYDSDNNGTADAFSSFTVYGILLENIPVINATSGSPWLVGLIWDKSDGGTEYDGTQDVAFIAELNPQTQGAFGINDYEARAPSSLKSLKDSLNLIATRMEVR